MSRILVTYGTRYGSTKEIAMRIGRILLEEGHTVDVEKASRTLQVDSYDLVVLGSGIQAGGWQKDAKNFMQRNSAAFKEIKIALFVSCGDAAEEEKYEESYKKYLVDPAKKNGLTPIAYGFFGGTFDFTGKKGFVYNMFMRIVKADFEKKGIVTEGVYDFRDWDAITEWTRALPKLIQ